MAVVVSLLHHRPPAVAARPRLRTLPFHTQPTKPLSPLHQPPSPPNQPKTKARMYVASRQACRLPADPKLAFCYDVLNTVSRSFAVVIQQLPNPLRDAICVFYLVLRGLDTVEDDMAIPLAPKVRDLRAFHEHIYKRGFTMKCGYGPYVRLMAEFDTVVDVFLGLDEGYQVGWWAVCSGVVCSVLCVCCVVVQPAVENLCHLASLIPRAKTTQTKHPHHKIKPPNNNNNTSNPKRPSSPTSRAAWATAWPTLRRASTSTPPPSTTSTATMWRGWWASG
jgi:hypothetical protein